MRKHNETGSAIKIQPLIPFEISNDFLLSDHQNETVFRFSQQDNSSINEKQMFSQGSYCEIPANNVKSNYLIDDKYKKNTVERNDCTVVADYCI